MRIRRWCQRTAEVQSVSKYQKNETENGDNFQSDAEKVQPQWVVYINNPRPVRVVFYIFRLSLT